MGISGREPDPTIRGKPANPRSIDSILSRDTLRPVEIDLDIVWNVHWAAVFKYVPRGCLAPCRGDLA